MPWSVRTAARSKSRTDPVVVRESGFDFRLPSTEAFYLHAYGPFSSAVETLGRGNRLKVELRTPSPPFGVPPLGGSPVPVSEPQAPSPGNFIPVAGLREHEQMFMFAKAFRSPACASLGAFRKE